MLAVGDPKQLPASVTSRTARDFGLDKSLFDRLMFGCGEEHMMLDLSPPPIFSLFAQLGAASVEQIRRIINTGSFSR